MTIIDDTRKSLYAILAKRVTQGNQYFQVSTKTGCRDSRGRSGKIADNFQTWANKEAKKLQSVKGNIIPVDDSILDGFPAIRPTRCLPLDSTKVYIDENGYRTDTPEKSVIGSADKKTADWVRGWYWKEKKRDFFLYKEKIDNYVNTLKIPVTAAPVPSEIVVTSSLIPLGIIGILLLNSSGGKK